MRTSYRLPLRPLRPQAGRAAQAGATMVEFAIVIPIALLLVLGIIQLGLMFSAKEVVNEAAFLAARAGAVQNAQVAPMTAAMQKGLIPFYQDTTTTDPAARLLAALAAARQDANFLTIQVLNPTPEAFQAFGTTSDASQGHRYIPNDNLEYRPHTPISGLSIQDANALRIQVTYGYQLKVPLMQSVINAIMCGIGGGLNAFGANSGPGAGTANDCTTYYSQGRVPIVAYATVQMQTPAWQQ
ncbi:MAG TPA: TadE family protein [Steroidobacteraceae bacterium]|jgi:Flp pilus assembly protein TadG